MANELERIWGTEVQLEASGASHNNNVLSAAATTVLDLEASGANQGFLHCRFILELTPAGAPTADTMVDLVYQALSIRTGVDAPAPTSTYRPTKRGFLLKSTTGAQTYEREVFWVPPKANWFIFPNGIGQNVTSWKLWARPFTTVPSA